VNEAAVPLQIAFGNSPDRWSGSAFDALQSLVASAIETLAIYPVHFQFQFQAMRAETSPHIDAFSPQQRNACFAERSRGSGLYLAAGG